MSRLPQDDARRLISEDKVCKIPRKSFLSTPAQAPVGALRVGLEHSLVAQLSVFAGTASPRSCLRLGFQQEDGSAEWYEAKCQAEVNWKHSK